MQHIFRVLATGQAIVPRLSVNRGSIFFFLGLLVALFALQTSPDLEAAAVNPIDVEGPAGLDADRDASQRPEVDDDDDDVDEAIERRLREAGRRIREAITAGEITAEEGRERMQGLRKRIAERRARGEASTEDDDGDTPSDGLRRRVETANRKVIEAMEAGEISAEEGRERLEGLRRRLAAASARGDASSDAEAKDDTDDAILRRIREARRRIGEAIEAGEITAEEGRERMEGMRRRIAKLQEKGDANVNGGDRPSDGNARRGGNGERRIRQAVEDGVITAEQGRERLEGLRKRIAEDRAKGAASADGGDRPSDGNARRGGNGERRIRQAVEDGVITAEQGRERLEGLRKRMAEDRATGDGDDLSDGIRRRVSEARRRIGEAIEAGEITAEEGRERMGELRKRIAERQAKGAGSAGDWEAITRRIEGAVERGVITREEADDVYSGIKKRRASAGDGDNKADDKTDKKERRVSGSALRERLEIAVETGRLTWDEARDRYIQAMEAGDGGRGAAARDRLNAGIELGRISEDEAVEKYIELMERPGAGKSDKKADQKFPKSKLPKSKLPKSQTITVEEYKKAAAKMKKAMEAGEMTEEQLKAKLEAWRRMIVD